MQLWTDLKNFLADRVPPSSRALRRHLLEMESKISELRAISEAGKRSAAEAVWAEVFNNTIQNSIWLKNINFSPGRWAVGYQYLYALYRVLDEARPQRILDLGLGQSSRMLAQYAAAHCKVEHVIVEHDPEWISFFQNNFSLPANSHVVQLEREMVTYNDADSVRVFKDFAQKFTGRKFDLISIDAPLGADMKQYARIDVLGILPDCLLDNFVIMLDDSERPGETNTLKEMEKKLKEHGIAYRKGRYSGAKDMTVLCSENWAFFASM